MGAYGLAGSLSGTMHSCMTWWRTFTAAYGTKFVMYLVFGQHFLKGVLAGGGTGGLLVIKVTTSRSRLVRRPSVSLAYACPPTARLPPLTAQLAHPQATRAVLPPWPSTGPGLHRIGPRRHHQGCLLCRSCLTLVAKAWAGNDQRPPACVWIPQDRLHHGLRNPFHRVNGATR